MFFADLLSTPTIKKKNTPGRPHRRDLDDREAGRLLPLLEERDGEFFFWGGGLSVDEELFRSSLSSCVSPPSFSLTLLAPPSSSASQQFPLCNGAHVAHNTETGDNVGPLIIKKD